MTYDYGEDTSAPASARWTSIDSRRVLPAGDLELLANARDAHAALGRLITELPSTLHQIRDSMAGHPRAATTEPRDSSPVPWCWEHERPTTECHQLDLLCKGEILDGPSDPTGTAAVTGDQAASDLREIRRRLERVPALVADLDARAAAYPSHAETDEAMTAGPGEHNCRLCWRDGQRIKPVDRDGKGRPYYKGLCRRCGRWRATLGGDPPAWFINRINRGDPITPGIEAKARREVNAAANTSTKPGGKGKSTKRAKPKAAS